MYRAIRAFFDTQDGDHYYAVGDTYPREGLQVSEKRIAALAGTKNRRHAAVIAPAQAEEEPETQDEAAEEIAEEIPEETTEEIPEETAEEKPKSKKKKG